MLPALKNRILAFVQTFGVDATIAHRVFYTMLNRPEGHYHSHHHVLTMGEHFVKHLDGKVVSLTENHKKILGYAILFHDYYPYAEKCPVELSAREAKVHFREHEDNLGFLGLSEEEQETVYALIRSTGKPLHLRVYNLNTLFGVLNTLDLGYWLFSEPELYAAKTINESVMDEALYYGYKEKNIILNRSNFLKSILSPNSNLMDKIRSLEEQIGDSILSSRFLANVIKSYSDAALTLNESIKAGKAPPNMA